MFRMINVVRHNHRFAILNLTVESTASVYILLLSLCYISTRKASFHRFLTYHIASLLAATLAYWYFATFGNHLAIGYAERITWDQYLALGVTVFALITVSWIPTGPPLYQDMSKLYSAAVTTKIKETNASDPSQPNVNPQVGASILSDLCFTFVFPVISRTSGMEQADLQDLPAAHAYFRTQNVLHESVQVNDLSGLRTDRKSSVFALLWTVWRPEKQRLMLGESSFRAIWASLKVKLNHRSLGVHDAPLSVVVHSALVHPANSMAT